MVSPAELVIFSTYVRVTLFLTWAYFFGFGMLVLGTVRAVGHYVPRAILVKSSLNKGEHSKQTRHKYTKLWIYDSGNSRVI